MQRCTFAAWELPVPPNLLDYEPMIRLGVFCGIFFVMATWEIFAPRRAQTIGRLQRWPSNLSIVVLNTVLVRFALPTAAVGVALAADAHSWGLFHFLATPHWLAVLVSLLLLDLAVYLQHVLFHAVPTLWRLHRMHHADLEFDVTTGARFHPLEILLSMLIKFSAISALGAPPIAVLVFEVVLNATAMFNHGNVYLPPNLDRVLRWFVVTPDMHRVHHSVVPRETNSNYGFNLSWWDRLLGTYRAVPAAGHQHMTIGIELFREPSALRLDRMLLQPFRDLDGSWIEAASLAKQLAQEDAPAILDVRGKAEFDGELGHLPGARNIPLAELTGRLAELFDWKQREVALVCLTQIRSAKALPILQAAGFNDVRVLRGGVQQWIREGLPVTHTPS